MLTDDHYFRREDLAVRWQRIASHIAEHPEDLAIPLANCNRWLSLGRVHPAPLLEWQCLIHAAQSSPEALLPSTPDDIPVPSDPGIACCDRSVATP